MLYRNGKNRRADNVHAHAHTDPHTNSVFLFLCVTIAIAITIDEGDLYSFDDDDGKMKATATHCVLSFIQGNAPFRVIDFSIISIIMDILNACIHTHTYKNRHAS